MSILIRGMDMPKKCNECKFCWDSIGERFCFLNGHIMFDIKSEIEKHPDCPLVEVPKHGRLIDADATLDVLRGLGERDYRRSKGTICDAMKMISSEHYTPTIIESEE